MLTRISMMHFVLFLGAQAKLKSIGLSLFGPRRKIYFAAQRWQEEHL